ncbi:hypothetical protein ACHHYP_07868 [Achlya hypogyna]|uniref:Putative auto-transporter adhesin head GIN domain-containing protein n=1 Tax=Achlya hypogyna TaxID=1202772 RepID=A0A1V9ZLB2_ACHHY|nr:hypothetical protein ACHHYP_07868 [Achlya hypogyna]
MANDPAKLNKADKATETADATVTSKVVDFEDKHIYALREGVCGSKVFVSTHQEKRTTVKLTGASADIERITAEVRLFKLGGRLLELNRDSSNAAAAEGRVLMEIFLNESQPLRAMESVGDSDVVLEDGTLHTHATVEKIGSGAMYLHFAKEVDMQQLHTVLRGSGLIQLDAPKLRVQTALQVDVVGSGSTRFHTHQLSAASILTKVTGSGDILFDATNLAVRQLASVISGSGAIRYHNAGTVDQHTMDVCGSGKVIATSLLSERALGSVTGSGEVLTQALKALDGSVFGSGSFKVCEPWPEHLAVTPRYEATQHVAKSFTPHDIPTRDLKFGFQKQFNLFGNAISINFDI